MLRLLSATLLLCLTSLHTLYAASALGNAALCSQYSGLPADWQTETRAGMEAIPEGEFLLGTNLGYAEERIEVKTNVKAFWIDQTEVTVAQFASFVEATGYVTEAEHEGGGAVFRIPRREELQQREFLWWQYVKGANWRHPQGPNTQAQANHPVTLVTFADALAYAHWLGHDLPSEAEWEYAAKAGVQDRDIEKEPRDAQGVPQANFWQGHFPLENTLEDGHQGVAPVGCFAANNFGLYDMLGNVWEQTQDIYRSGHSLYPDPKAAELPATVPESRVIKGGSHLCAQDYCVRYRPSARETHEANLPMGHIGFRTVWREPGDTEDWFTALWH